MIVSCCQRCAFSSNSLQIGHDVGSMRAWIDIETSGYVNTASTRRIIGYDEKEWSGSHHCELGLAPPVLIFHIIEQQIFTVRERCMTEYVES